MPSYLISDAGFCFQAPVLEMTGSVSLDDEYRFLKKYFSPWWSYCYFLANCLQLHNPLAEARAFYSAREVARVKIWELMAPPLEGDDAASNHDRKVSVVIPTLNRYEYLIDALGDLEKQTYKNFEVIVVDQRRARGQRDQLRRGREGHHYRDQAALADQRQHSEL